MTAANNRARPCIVLSAGGTGGHLFPAEALARALDARGFDVELATDTRAIAYAAAFPARGIHALDSGTPSGGSLIGKVKAGIDLARGTWQAGALLRRIKPAAVVGFGGYPSVPAVMAATLARVPSIIHEQNAVLGRANRFLASRVTAIATGFETVGGIGTALREKTSFVGNPVRPAVIDAAKTPFRPLTSKGKMHLVVFGGSQGARVMADIVPLAVAMMPGAMRARLTIVQQTRAEDMDRVRAAYSGFGVEVELAPFFADLPARIAASHLVIGRSGAGSVAELAVIGRPSILVPLPGSLDQDQAANAKVLGDVGAATVMNQREFTPERLANALLLFLAEPETLTQGAAKAKSAGVPDATDRLAYLVARLTRKFTT